MKLKYFLAASAAGLTTAVALPAPLAAQQITSGVEGTVTDESGAPLAGATVVVTDTRTGQVRTLTTNANGDFRAVSLVPGGPYTVSVTAGGFEGQTIEDQFINISGNTAYTFTLMSSTGADNMIVVTAERVNVQQLAVGPGTAFGETTLEAFPSLSRDVRDIIRLDPRVSLERSDEVDRISCLGGNDRSNTFTVDGIVQADTFGLNGTPFAARNSLPLPYDVIRETSVEFAPFDVEYSDFTGCLVNVVTKSGQNKFHGSAFYTFFNDSMLADTIIDGDGVEQPLSSGSEKRWGATLGGPIIPDRLFFYLGYEETDLGDANDEGPVGGGFANEVDGISQADFDRFAQIARDVYGQDVGGYPRTLAESSVRYFGRIDAYITDGQRLEATYQRLEESNVEPDFGSDALGGLNSFEEEGTVSDYYSLRLYSDWSDKISTEVRLSRAEVTDVQGPFGFGEAQSDNPTVRLAVAVENNGDVGLLSTGPGIFRSANALAQTVNQAKFQMNIDGGDHQFKIGAELNDLEVYNLFAINATGTLYFANLDNFEQGIVNQGFSFFPSNEQIRSGAGYGADINATPTGDINEAAATFKRQIYSFYAQDEWQASDQLSLTAGVRVQFYDGDAPRENPEFFARYGFTNANPFSRLDPVILPRLSATYELDNEGFFSNTRVTGGVGIFSGGDPMVYFSNAFSNNGFSTGLGTSVFCGAGQFPTDVVVGGQFTGFPQCVTAAGSATAARGLADTQSTDPNFDVPTVVRANLGISTDFGTESGFFSDWRLNVDYIYSRFNDTLNFVDLSQTPDIRINGGFTVDGRPIYAAIDPTDPDAAGCNAQLVNQGGTPPTWINVTPICFNRIGRDDEIQLTNGPSYESHIASFLLSKNFNRGIFTEGGSVGLRFGYAYTDSNNNRNVGSSTATSSFDVSAAFDRQNPAVSTSNYETRHNITASIFFREEFFGDYRTSLGMFFRARSGRPYSLTFDGGGVFNDSSSGNDNALLYVPSGVNDPNLSPLSDPNTVREAIDYVAASGCDYTPGETIKRNTCRNPWHFDLDLRISQELPFIGKMTGLVDDRIELFADFDNFLNFLDSGWNRLKFQSEFTDVLDGEIDAQGRYIFDETNNDPLDPYMYINPDDDQSVGISSSAWKIQVGVRYEF
ncbi:TonB-dependent receptor [Parerythrobacter aestuarii]|uniref:TonB-dependent receptor n=1 Tax=Parerythrobacter aestuarii TaxID=3020909 RepID=UPI0024DE8AAF|nr:carboxypeptidase regulatory-like domain-containing protein [Parerythrobacter aestuarii]